MFNRLPGWFFSFLSLGKELEECRVLGKSFSKLGLGCVGAHETPGLHWELQNTHSRLPGSCAPLGSISLSMSRASPPSMTFLWPDDLWRWSPAQPPGLVLIELEFLVLFQGRKTISLISYTHFESVLFCDKSSIFEWYDLDQGPLISWEVFTSVNAVWDTSHNRRWQEIT